MMSRQRTQMGFTVVEVMVALVVLSLVGLALGATFLVGYTAISYETRQIAADSAVSNASLTLLRDLSSATVNSILPDTISTGAGSLVLTYGTPPASTTVTYTIDANNNLLRTLSGFVSGSFVAARGVNTLTVATGTPACELTVSLLPSAAGATVQTLTVSQRTLGCF